MSAALEADLLAAHAANDRPRLISLYTQAAEVARVAGRLEAEGFYLTHAYVFALESGSDRAADLRDRLRHLGREA